MAHYTAGVLWLREEQNFLGNRYSGRHVLRLDGGLEVPCSSSPRVVALRMSDAMAMDPEETFVASISSCHMLWLLSIAAKQRFCADRHCNTADRVMGRYAEGKMAMTAVTRRPAVQFSGEHLPTREQIKQVDANSGFMFWDQCTHVSVEGTLNTATLSLRLNRTAHRSNRRVHSARGGRTAGYAGRQALHIQ
jgi:organic hydroperoxide reductase OsmC/OhrA